VINDHTDAAYDREVLERLAALHADAVAWLVPLEAQAALLDEYHARLDRAAEQAIAGDGRFGRLAARRQLPRRLVRAPRGAHPARRPDPQPTRLAAGRA
jgi:hypothetical protein